MNNLYADLHSHTTNSDGKLSTSELIAKAEDKKFKAFSITDHDTIAAYSELTSSINIVSGIELTVYYNNKEVHLLAYNFNISDTDLNNYLDSIKQQRVNRAKNIITQLNNLEINIKFDEIYDKLEGDIITRSHIADELIEKDYAKNIYDVFQNIMTNDKISIPKVEFINFEDAIKLIKNAGGFVSIAHPNKHFTSLQIYNMIKQGMRCIEVYHPSHNFYTTRSLLSFAKQYQLKQSGGSDYHGKHKNEENNFGHYGLTEEQYFNLKREFKINYL